MEETGLLFSQKVQQLSYQLQQTTEIFKNSDLPGNLNQLLTSYVHLIRDRLEYYCVGLYLMEDINEINDSICTLIKQGYYTNLLDEDEQRFRLRAITGENGQLLVKNAYSRKIGYAHSVAEWVLQHRQAYIMLDVGEEAVRFHYPYFPETRSEIDLPLISQEELVGVLEIRSSKEAAFSNEDIPLLQSLADSLANIIQEVLAFCKQRGCSSSAE